MSADTAEAIARTVENLQKVRDLLRDGDTQDLLLASLLDFEVNKLTSLLELEKLQELRRTSP